MNHLIYATSNPGKIIEMTKHLGALGIKVNSLKDFGIGDFDVAETGVNLGENAEIKVRAYLEALKNKTNLRGDKFLVISDDTGIEIAGLNGEPGIKVRRWKGYKMTDTEIVEHVLFRMKDLKGDGRVAQFRTVAAIGTLNPEGEILPEIKFFEGSLKGRILEEPTGNVVPGFPFEQLFFVPEWGMHLGGVYSLSQEEKDKLLNHRERAVTSAIPYLKAEL